MPRNRKPELYRLLKDRGLPMTTSYMQYTTEGLISELKAAGVQIPDLDPPIPTAKRLDVSPPAASEHTPEAPRTYEPPPQVDVQQAMQAQYEALVSPPSEAELRASQPPRSNQADPDEMPAQRLNTQAEDEPIRVDDQGRIWYQEEVRKPAFPKPRGRRVLKYIERGVEKETVQNGEYIETFEIAGKGPGRPAEVKITLPSYQVGIYKDPRFPFKIHCYNDREGFDLFEVNDFYGAAELVPEMCKRIYIENDLCYDIRSVVRAIQTEHRQLQLTGRI